MLILAGIIPLFASLVEHHEEVEVVYAASYHFRERVIIATRLSVQTQSVDSFPWSSVPGVLDVDSDAGVRMRHVVRHSGRLVPSHLLQVTANENKRPIF